MNDWMLPRLTDYWDQQVEAIDRFSRELAGLDQPGRKKAMRVIAAAVAEHIRVIPDDLLLRVAIPVVDDLYKAVCSIDRWDSALDAYLRASAGTFADLLTQRGIRIQYLVDNLWEDMTRPVQLFGSWYRAAGFVYVCPQVLALELAGGDGLSQAPISEVMPRYVDEGRDLANQLVERCQAENRHFFQLDTDSTDDSFATALNEREKPGVLTISRNEAPTPGSKVAVWPQELATP